MKIASRHTRWRLLGLMALMIFVLGLKVQAQKKPPNVLLIMIDDLRPELKAYGAEHIISPNIDKLSASGTTFAGAYCQFPVCSPSRASMLTGTRPTTTKVLDLYSDFREALPGISSLPEWFKKNGYYTDRFGKIFHIDDAQSWTPNYPKQKFGPGEPEKRAPYASKELNEAGWRKFDAAKAKGLKGVPLERSQRGPALEVADVADEDLLDGKIANQAILGLQHAAKSAKPFFIGVGFHKPHLPFVAPKKYWDLYDRNKISIADTDKLPENAPFALGNAAEFYTYTDVPQQRPVPPDYVRAARHGYYACVSFVDAQVGKVLDELERLGLDKNTVVLLVGDHGFKLGEHGSWGKSTTYEWDARVPLIVRVPGGKKAQTTKGLVEMIDIYPTLAELANLPLPVHLEGKSFVKLLHHPEKKGKDAAFTQLTRGDRMGYSMRTEKYRFTRWVKAGEADAWELYDVKQDPLEHTNLAVYPEMKKTCLRLSKQMDRAIEVQHLAKALTDEA